MARDDGDDETPYSNLEDPEKMNRDLQCLCVENASQFHFKHISSLELIRASVYCPNIQLIATLKNGRKICLDPQTTQNKKIIRKLLKSQLLSA
ncbi:platelet factor 4-like [Suncus etruscus]|uniref:platelet factor 4-like n=1 Tax=Suncus etruscus TaxID=109475 RepID=UPI00210F6ABE|nr:platelet factor 4-like [Suncus etruscus]